MTQPKIFGFGNDRTRKVRARCMPNLEDKQSTKTKKRENKLMVIRTEKRHEEHKCI